jgi:hypothetical protein
MTNNNLTPRLFVSLMLHWCDEVRRSGGCIDVVAQEVTAMYGGLVLSMPDRFIDIGYEVRDDYIDCCCILRRIGPDGQPERWNEMLWFDRPKDSLAVAVDTLSSASGGGDRTLPTRASNDPEAAITLAQKLVEKAMTLDKSAWRQ